MAQRPQNRKPSQRQTARKTTRPSSNRRSGGGGNAVVAFMLGAACVGGGGYLYLHNRPSAPVREAVSHADRPVKPAPVAPAVPKPAPTTPAAATDTPPFGASEDVFEAGAKLYHAQCAQCHGSPAHDAKEQGATQYFAHGADPARIAHPTANFKAIQTGVPMTAMPAYKGKLTERQTWQLALLLQASSAELPNPVVKILNGK